MDAVGDTLTQKGKWWFPGKSENKFDGEIKFSQSGSGTLILIDTMDKLFNFPRDMNDFLLMGELEDDLQYAGSKKISVLISYVSNYREKYAMVYGTSRVYIELRVKYIFLGIHLQNKDIEFDRVILSFSNVDNWISPMDDLLKEPVSDQDEYKSRDILIDDLCKFKIISNPKVDKEGTKWVTQNNIAFVIEGTKDKSFDRYLYIKNKIQDFLNFVVTKPVVLQLFDVLYRNEDKAKPIVICLQSVIDEKMNKVEIKSPFLVTYGEIVKTKGIDRVLHNWFQLNVKGSAIMDLYFGVMYNTRSYLTNNFLMLFTALEIYHHIYLDKDSQRKKQKFLIYNEFVQKIGEFNLKDDDRERLKQLLSSLKGLTSKERIEEIYDQFGDILPHLSTKIGDKHQFIEKIVKFRNRFVHGNVQFRELDNEDLFWQFKNLQLILQLCILSKLDFSIEQIRELYYLDKIPAPHNA